MDIVSTDHINGSRVAGSICVPKDRTSIIDGPLLEFMFILIANTLIPYVVTRVIVNELAEPNTHVSTKIKESTSDVQGALVESSASHMIFCVRFQNLRERARV